LETDVADRPVSDERRSALFLFSASEATMKNSALYLLVVAVAAVVASFTYLVTSHKNMEEGKLDIALGKTNVDMTFKDRQIELKQMLATALSDDKDSAPKGNVRS
jgi:hypothetical protein